ALRVCAYAALLLAPGALEPVGLCRDHALFLVGHAPPDQCAHSGGLWPEAPRHPQRPRLHGVPDRGGGGVFGSAALCATSPDPMTSPSPLPACCSLRLAWSFAIHEQRYSTRYQTA